MTHPTLLFQPLVPGPVLVLLGLLALATLLAGLLAGARGILLRFLAFALGLLILAGPVRQIRTGTPEPRIALLAIDHSASMRIGNRTALAQAAAAKLAQDAAATPGLTLRRVDFGNDGAGTRMFAAIDRALADIPPGQRAGVIAITDGAIADPPHHFGLPLDLLIPARGEQPDRRIRLLDAPQYGIVGQDVPVRFVVEDLGAPPGAVVDLTIRQDDAAPTHRSVIAGSPTTLSLPLRHAGPSTIALTAAPLAHEASVLNNQAAFTIDGVRDRLRVLLISGEPNQDERTWRRLLKSDPAVDLVHFTILRPPGRDDDTPLDQLALIAFPIRELFVEKIRHFDLIILDRFSESGLLPPSYLDNIVSYVRQGGALLVCAGPEFADAGSIASGPVGDILPAQPLDQDAVIDGRFQPIVTPLGHRHPVTEALPGDAPPGPPRWGPWYRRLAVGPVKGDVLLAAGAGGPPLLILSRVDQGRVALLLSDQIWLWARGIDGGGPQQELLRRVAHWAMKQPELDENSLTLVARAGALRAERHAIAALPPGAALTLIGPDGTHATLPWTLTPDGREIARRADPAPGLWQASYGGQTAFAAVAPSDPVEWSDLRATAHRVGPLARSVHWLDPAGAPKLASLSLLRGPALRLTGIATAPLLPAWFALPLLLLLGFGAWRREGR